MTHLKFIGFNESDFSVTPLKPRNHLLDIKELLLVYEQWLGKKTSGEPLQRGNSNRTTWADIIILFLQKWLRIWSHGPCSWEFAVW